MKTSDVLALLCLAALWGGSYLFLRLGAAEFGPAPLAALRAIGAALLLAPMVLRRDRLRELRQHAPGILTVGVLHSALPYLLFSYASLTITAGFAAILTATTPLFTTLVARCWLGEPWSLSKGLGLVLGLAGVTTLVAHRAGVQTEGNAPLFAIGACLIGALCYGTAATYSKRALGNLTPSSVAAGTQLVAALLLAGPGWAAWPTTSPSPRAWAAALALAAASTAFAYVLFFRLIRRIGPARTVTVTFLIPIFGMLWGTWLLHEPLTGAMLVSVAVILAGTALTTGLVTLPHGRLDPSAIPRPADQEATVCRGSQPGGGGASDRA